MMERLKKGSRCLWVLVCLLLVVGCAPGEPGNSSNDAGIVENDGGQMDGGGDEADGGPTADADGGGETCVPKTTCGENECGMVGDGCGGTLDCGTCACKNGVAEIARCGICDLGVRKCGDSETGSGTCVGPTIPGLSSESDEETCSSKLLFVDNAASGGGTADGSRQEPFGTYSKARQAAESGQTIIMASEQPYEERVKVKDGVSVIGGFSAAPDFKYLEANRTKVEVPVKDGASAVKGLVAENIAQESTVARMSVITSDAEAGMNNYGAYVIDSPVITLRQVQVEAGKGGKGKSGKDGSEGDSGGFGDDGFWMGWSCCPNWASANASNAGKNSSCPKANGGSGGRGGATLQQGAGQSTLTSNAGEPSKAGVQGGERGEDGVMGKEGKTGRNGRGGADGRNGSAKPAGGSVMGEKWTPEGKGANGEKGTYGEGGGGGGGAYRHDTCWKGQSGDLTGEFLEAAPAGAGGGAGGCGGTGGKGGEPGYGSFGLFVVRSDVKLVGSEFRASFGGQGGNGGQGGKGGSGGSGGTGTPLMNVDGCTQTDLGYSSGDGGDGAKGGDGGAGAGGAGGVSYGAYCFESTPTLKGETRFESGGKANGGVSPGEDGRAGIAQDSFNCQ